MGTYWAGKPMGHPDMGSGAALGMRLCDICKAAGGARGGGECLERKWALTQPLTLAF